MPTNVFLSYRRSADDVAERLFAALSTRFGQQHVFKDIESLKGGSDYVATLESALAMSDALVAMIDPYWAVDHTGRNRLMDAGDWLRREIETALRRQIAVFPVVLEGAHVPRVSTLPPSMHGFERLHALQLRRGFWDHDVAVLAAHIDRDQFERAGGEHIVVEGGHGWFSSPRQPVSMIEPGSRVVIRTWAGTMKKEVTGLPFELAAAAGQRGTVLQIDAHGLALVRWDRQEWSKRFFGVLRGSTIPLDSFTSSIHVDWLKHEPS